MKNKLTVKLIAIPVILSLLLAVGSLAACGEPATELSGTLQIFNAGSLSVPLEQINEEFNKLYPDVEILAEAAGSATTIRKVTELGK
jgi:molybdate/tungstate transport system substrate-binding protein